MANIPNKPIQDIWASQTTNITPSSDADVSGIKFGSEIVSDQLNGALNTLSNQVAYNQYNGGVYDASLTYNVGNVVSVNYQENNANKVVNSLFRCINDNGGAGIKNIAPLLNATSTVNNGSIVMQGSGVNSTYWEQISGVNNNNPKVYIPAPSYTLNTEYGYVASSSPLYFSATTGQWLNGFGYIRTTIDNPNYVVYKAKCLVSINLGNYTNPFSPQLNNTYFPNTPSVKFNNNSLMQGSWSGIVGEFIVDIELEYQAKLLQDIRVEIKQKGILLEKIIPHYTPTVFGLGCPSMTALVIFGSWSDMGNYSSYPIYNGAYCNMTYGAYPSIATMASQNNSLTLSFMSNQDNVTGAITVTPLEICDAIVFKEVDSQVDIKGNQYSSNVWFVRMFRVAHGAGTKSLENVGAMQFFNSNTIPSGYYPLRNWLMFDAQCFYGFGSLTRDSYNTSQDPAANGCPYIPFLLYYNGYNDESIVFPYTELYKLGLNPFFGIQNTPNNHTFAVTLMDQFYTVQNNATLQANITNGGNGYSHTTYSLTFTQSSDKLPVGTSWSIPYNVNVPSTTSIEQKSAGAGNACPINPNIQNLNFNDYPIDIRAMYGANNPNNYSTPPSLMSVLCMKIY